MRRRCFLGALAFGPLWLRRAFADASLGQPVTPSAGPDRYREALSRARAAGRPLLVLVIPDDDGEKRSRGQAFGEWILHGDDVYVASLAQVEVVCLRRAEVDVEPYGPGDPLMVLVRGPGAPHAELHADLFLPRRRDEEAQFRRRVAILGDWLREALGSMAPPSARAPELAALARARLSNDAPPGAHWARCSGCATHIEPTREEKEAKERKRREALRRGVITIDPIVAIGCGMGSVPEKSRRFLYLFAKVPEGYVE